jgi:uncharacterized protein YjlB
MLYQGVSPVLAVGFEFGPAAIAHLDGHAGQRESDDDEARKATPIARGKATVRFGGSRGRVLKLKAGDVAVLPAGTGHERLDQSADLLVVGAYPPFGKYDECRASAAEHDRAVKTIPKVPLPRRDPVYGSGRPLVHMWTSSQNRGR